MTKSTFVNGTVGNADEMNKLIIYYDEDTDATSHSCASTSSWETLKAFTGLTALSSTAYIKGIYVKTDIDSNNAANSLAIKISGTNMGDIWVRCGNSSNPATVINVETAYFGGTLTQADTETYIPLPPNMFTGDATYDITIRGYRGVGGTTMSIDNTTVRLYTTDDVAAQL